MSWPPYLMYILADAWGLSGVLAVVVSGLIGSRFLAKHQSSLRRVVGFAVWDIFVILMNSFVFILIGLQLKRISTVMSVKQIVLNSAYGMLMTVALIAIRLAWVYAKSGIAYLKALSRPSTTHLCPKIMREAAIIGWSGMRGIVSLAAALALPHTLPNGQPVAGLNEVLFITFVVILLTLILPSCTLSYLIQWLKIEHQIPHHDAHLARKRLAEVAAEKIADLHHMQEITDKENDFLTNYFFMQRAIFEIATSPSTKLSKLESMRLRVFQAQREVLLDMWEKQQIDDHLFKQLLHELDIDEAHRSRAQLVA